MSQLDKTALVAKLNSFITTNGVGYITGAVAREIMRDMIDSSLNTLDEMPTYLKRTGTISGQPITGTMEFDVALYEALKQVSGDDKVFVNFDAGQGLDIGALVATKITQMQIIDGAINFSSSKSGFAGAKYSADYSSNFTARSLVDKGYADGKIDSVIAAHLLAGTLTDQAYVTSQINALIASAPGALDTLNELAAAMGDDPNFAATVTAVLAGKEPTITAGTTGQYYRGDKTWQTLDKAAVGLSSVPDVDATNPANISQTASYRFVTDTEKGSWNAKEPAITGTTSGQYYRGNKTFADLNVAAVTGLQAALDVVNKGTLSFNLKGYLSSGMSALIASVVSGGTITSWYIEGEEASGNVVVDLQRWNGSSYVSIIGAGNKPTISAAKNANAAVASWTSVALAANDRLRFLVDSVSSFSEVNLQIKYTKS